MVLNNLLLLLTSIYRSISLT